MLGLDTTALIVGFIAGVVLWGGLSFVVDWITNFFKRRNTPDYAGEVARLNGRILELESALNDAANGGTQELEQLRATNEALQAELAEHAEAAADAVQLRERLAELEGVTAGAGDTEAALAEATARANAAESALEDAKATLVHAERALTALAEQSRTSLEAFHDQAQQASHAGSNGNGEAHASTAAALAAARATESAGEDAGEHSHA